MKVRTSLLALLSTMLFCSISARAEDKLDANDPSKYYLATEHVEHCIARWDEGTHMTKEQCRDTCKRISEERAEHLRKNGTLPEGK